MNATTFMSSVKIITNFDKNEFTIKYYQSVPKGQKFDIEKAELFASQTFDLTKLSASIFVDCPAARHGIKQKLIDNLAITAETKLVTTVQMAIDSENDLFNQLVAGNWNAKGTGKKAATMKLDAIELKFTEGVKSGLTTYETAATLYFSLTGKKLPVIELDEDDNDN